MAEVGKHAKGSLLPGVVAMALATAYLIALLAAEKQALIIGLLACWRSLPCWPRIGWDGSPR